KGWNVLKSTYFLGSNKNAGQLESTNFSKEKLYSSKIALLILSRLVTKSKFLKTSIANSKFLLGLNGPGEPAIIAVFFPNNCAVRSFNKPTRNLSAPKKSALSPQVSPLKSMTKSESNTASMYGV